MKRLYAVVLAGGRGGRIWPLSREDRPKPFLPLGADGTSLLSMTCGRLGGVVDLSRILVVGSAAHGGLVRQEVPELAPENFLAESESRGTAAAVALAARAVQARDPEGLLLVCPSDQLIADSEAFSRAVRFAVDCYDHLPAEQDPATVVLGVEAGTADPGYGYIVCGDQLEELDGMTCHRASDYVEKPERETAETLIEEEGALVSTGIFLWSAEGYLRLLDSYLPSLGRALDGDQQEADFEVVSVDHGILEKAEDIAVVRAPFSCSDLGTWERYASQLEAVDGGNRARGRFVGLDTENCIVLSDRRIVATVGVRDLVIVETEDAILVCHRDCAERVGELSEEVARTTRAETTSR